MLKVTELNVGEPITHVPLNATLPAASTGDTVEVLAFVPVDGRELVSTATADVVPPPPPQESREAQKLNASPNRIKTQSTLGS
jgi:hypothetical protein